MLSHSDKTTLNELLAERNRCVTQLKSPTKNVSSENAVAAEKLLALVAEDKIAEEFVKLNEKLAEIVAAVDELEKMVPGLQASYKDVEAALEKPAEDLEDRFSQMDKSQGELLTKWKKLETMLPRPAFSPFSKDLKTISEALQKTSPAESSDNFSALHVNERKLNTFLQRLINNAIRLSQGSKKRIDELQVAVNLNQIKYGFLANKFLLNGAEKLAALHSDINEKLQEKIVKDTVQLYANLPGSVILPKTAPSTPPSTAKVADESSPSSSSNGKMAPQRFFQPHPSSQSQPQIAEDIKTSSCCIIM